MPRTHRSRRSHTDSSRASGTDIDNDDGRSIGEATHRSFGVESKSTIGGFSAAKSVRSARSASQRTGGGKRGDAEIKKQLALKKKFEQEAEAKQQIYGQLAIRHDEQRRLIERMSEGLKRAAETHRQNLEQGRVKILTIKENIADCIERVEEKNLTIEDNKLQIEEWRELLLSDEVRRAYNFILRNPNQDLLGVKPEEVFSGDMMQRFYACKNRIKHDRKLEMERMAHMRLCAAVAGLIMPAACVLIHDIQEAHKFRRAVMKSVGMRAQGNIGIGGEWLVAAQQMKEAEAKEEKEELEKESERVAKFSPPDPMLYGDPDGVEALMAAGVEGFRPSRPYAARDTKRFERFAPHPPVAPKKLSPLQAMLAECRQTIQSLEFIGSVGEPEKKYDMLVMYKNKAFETDRMEQEFDMERVDSYFWKPLPGKLGDEPVARWK